ncbi:SDR family NAD(P)-dependent oxidoreductase [Streptomyces mayteni]
MSTLTDRTALVTGASRGIGAAIATRLAAEGATVIAHFNGDERGAAATVDRIAGAGGTARAVRAELGVDGDVETLFAGVEAALAGRPLDILVNNAAAPPAGPLGTTTRAEFDHLFAVNVCAPYFTVQHALPLIPDGGRIVTISSVATRMANPAQTSFAMTKAAVETMSRTLANQLGPRGITVNAVAPGATRTPTNGAVFDVPGLVDQITALTALDRLGGPDDIADVVAFLASDAARWITGQTIDATGGLFLGPRG